MRLVNSRGVCAALTIARTPRSAFFRSRDEALSEPQNVHRCGAGLGRAIAELPQEVVPPALDRTACGERARVVLPHGHRVHARREPNDADGNGPVVLRTVTELAVCVRTPALHGSDSAYRARVRAPRRNRPNAGREALNRDRDGAGVPCAVSQLTQGPLSPAKDAAFRRERARVIGSRGDGDDIRGQPVHIQGDSAAVNGRVLVIVVANRCAIAKLALGPGAPALHAARCRQHARMTLTRCDRDDPARKAGGDLRYGRPARVHGPPALDRAPRGYGARVGGARIHEGHACAEAADLGGHETLGAGSISESAVGCVTPALGCMGGRDDARVPQAARDALNTGRQPIDVGRHAMMRGASITGSAIGSPAPHAPLRRQRAGTIAARSDRAHYDVTRACWPPGLMPRRQGNGGPFVDNCVRFRRDRRMLCGPLAGSDQNDPDEPCSSGTRSHAPVIAHSQVGPAARRRSGLVGGATGRRRVCGVLCPLWLSFVAMSSSRRGRPSFASFRCSPSRAALLLSRRCPRGVPRARYDGSR